MHQDQNRMCTSLLEKILEEYVLPLKNIDRDIFSKQCPYLNFSNQPMRYVTDNYLLHTCNMCWKIKHKPHFFIKQNRDDFGSQFHHSYNNKTLSVHLFRIITSKHVGRSSQ